MIIDPYKVLDVSPDISDSELKQTYRELSKKYHPDANPDNREESEEKFKEIQEAYRQIVDARQRGDSGYGYQTSQSPYGNAQGGGTEYAEYSDFREAFGDFFSRWQEEARAQQNSYDGPLEMKAAANYINSGYYREALNALSGIPENMREARWYYYSAVANSGMGNNATALEHAKTACDMDPDSFEYRNYLKNLQYGGSWYQEQGDSYGPITFNTGWCLSLCALNALCNICAGPCCI